MKELLRTGDVKVYGFDTVGVRMWTGEDNGEQPFNLK